MPLNTSTFITSLIGLGPDASLNLFKIRMTGTGSDTELDILDGRLTTFMSPQRDSGSTDLPYQNTVISIPTPSTTIPKTMDMTIRIDSGYQTLDKLRSLQLINENGKYKKDNNKKISQMTVTAYEPGSKGEYNLVYVWVFYNLYVLSVTRASYTYESASQLTCNITLLWENYIEGLATKGSTLLANAYSSNQNNNFEFNPRSNFTFNPDDLGSVNSRNDSNFTFNSKSNFTFNP